MKHKVRIEPSIPDEIFKVCRRRRYIHSISSACFRVILKIPSFHQVYLVYEAVFGCADASDNSKECENRQWKYLEHRLRRNGSMSNKLLSWAPEAVGHRQTEVDTAKGNLQLGD